MIEEQLSVKFQRATKRALLIEYRRGYGWFIAENISGNEHTLMGFHSKRLLVQYLHNVIRRGHLYTPSVGETYGYPK